MQGGDVSGQHELAGPRRQHKAWFVLCLLSETCTDAQCTNAPLGSPPLAVLCLLQQFLFLKQKCRSLFAQRKRPAKLAWTTLYRKQHRKVRSLCSLAPPPEHTHRYVLLLGHAGAAAANV